MTLTEQITRDIAEAMKARDATRLSALRMVKAALMNGEVSKGRALEEAARDRQEMAKLAAERANAEIPVSSSSA